MAESLEKKTMRAAVVRRFGPPEAIVVEEMPKPEPAALPVVAEGGPVASACALQGDLELRKGFPLDQAAEAHAEIEHGHGRGKLVLRIQPERPARRRDANESAA
jgi:Zinc-binding dehydrogenase